MRRWWNSLLVIALAVLASGCWDLHELNDIGIVTGMGIDQGGKHPYRLTIEDINPTELAGNQKSGAAPVVIFSQEGEALPELRYRMNVGVTRKTIYSHLRVVAVSDRVARAGMRDFIDFLERDREIRDDFNFVIVKGSTAENMLRTTYPLQKIPSLKISTQIDTINRDWGGDTNARLNTVAAALTSPGREPVAELVGFQGDPEKGSTVDDNKDLTPKALVVLKGMAIFKNDKMIGELPLEDVRNYLWIEGRINHTSLTVPCEKGKRFAVRVNHNRTDIRARYAKGVPQIEVNVKFEGLLEGTQCPVDLTQAQTYRTLEEKANRFVEKKLAGTIRKVQTQFGVDSFGFGEDMYRQDTGHFKQVQNSWNREFQKAIITVHADAHLRRAGIRTKTILNEMK